MRGERRVGGGVLGGEGWAEGDGIWGVGGEIVVAEMEEEFAGELVEMVADMSGMIGLVS